MKHSEVYFKITIPATPLYNAQIGGFFYTHKCTTFKSVFGILSCLKSH